MLRYTPFPAEFLRHYVLSDGTELPALPWCQSEEMKILNYSYELESYSQPSRFQSHPCDSTPRQPAHLLILILTYDTLLVMSVMSCHV